MNKKTDDRPFSTFDHELCCLHAGGSQNWVHCGKCGTTCLRDSEGKIVAYSRGTWDLSRKDES